MTSILDIFNIPLGWLFKIAYNLTDNYALALLLFAVVMQILLLPLAIKQQKNQIRQASLAPKVAAINKKYAGRADKATQEKKNADIMALYQKENFNPGSGCLPLLLQMPIIIALYNVVRYPLRYICGIGEGVINNVITAVNTFLGTNTFDANNQISMAQYISQNIKNEDFLSVVVGDSTIKDIFTGVNLPNFSFLGLDLSEVPVVWPLQPLIILPIVMLAALYLSQWLMKKFQYQDPTTKDAQNNCSMKIMMWSMPLLSFFFAFQLSAAICLYWLYRNLLQLLQSFILAKVMPLPKLTEEDYKKAEHDVMSSSAKKKEKKEKVRSLHHIDDDDYEDTKQVPAKKGTNKQVTMNEQTQENTAQEEQKVEEVSEENISDEKPASIIEQAPLKDDNDNK